MKILNKWGLAVVGSLFLGAMTPTLVGAVTLNAATTPSTGVAGVSNVNLNGSGYPTGSILPAAVNVHLSASCGGAILANTTALSVQTIIGSTRRVQFQVPGSLAAGTYFVTLDGATAAAVPFSSDPGQCSQIAVTTTNATLSSCVPTSSLGINAPVNAGPVTAIVPRGAWSGGTTGIRMVQLEGAPLPGFPVSIPTAATVNSCAANPATGQSVCVANNTSVYLLNSAGALTNTLSSGSNSFTSFSGGSCQNCGVAVNALTNQAIINMGLTGGASGSGVQVLNLSNNTFQAPFPMNKQVSENISIDPTRGYILSPSEGGSYNLVTFNSATGAITGEFAKPTGLGGEPDSAAEDCTTGIALSVGEFTNQVFLADLTQATFTPGAPAGTWAAPSSITTIIGSYSAGLSGVTVAPGSSHLAIVTGEFGGSSFAVVKLPTTSGSGTPAIVDYAYVPGICTVNAGLDPHTISAYTSPNNGNAYAVMASGGPPPDKLAVIDLAAVLAAPRAADGHTLSTLAGGQICDTTTPNLVRFVAVPL